MSTRYQLLCLVAILSCSSTVTTRGMKKNFQNCRLHVSHMIFNVKLVSNSYESLDLLQPFVALIFVNANTTGIPNPIVIVDYGDNSTVSEIHLSGVCWCPNDWSNFISRLGATKFENRSLDAAFDYKEHFVSLESCFVAVFSHNYYSYGNKQVRFEITTPECREARVTGHIIERYIKANTLEETLGDISFLREPVPLVVKVEDKIAFFIGIQKLYPGIQCTLLFNTSKIKILLQNRSQTLPEWVPAFNQKYFKGIYVHTFTRPGIHTFTLKLEVMHDDINAFSVYRMINISVVHKDTPRLTLYHKQIDETNCLSAVICVPLLNEYQNIFNSFLNKETVNCNVLGVGLYLITNQEVATDMFEEVQFLILYNKSYSNVTMLLSFGDNSSDSIVAFVDKIFSIRDVFIWDSICDIRLNYGLIRHSYSTISGDFDVKLVILNSSRPTNGTSSCGILTAKIYVKPIKESTESVVINVDTKSEMNGDSVISIFIRKVLSFMTILLYIANGTVSTQLNVTNQHAITDELKKVIIPKEFSNYSYMALTVVSFSKSGCFPISVNITTPSGLESYTATKFVYTERGNIPSLGNAAIVYDDSVKEHPDATESVNFLVIIQTIDEGPNYFLDFGDGSNVNITFLSDITISYWMSSNYYQMASNGYSMAAFDHAFSHAGQYSISLNLLLPPEKNYLKPYLVCQTSIDVQSFTAPIGKLIVRLDPIYKTIFQEDFVLLLVVFPPTLKATSLHILFGDSCQTAFQLINSSAEEAVVDKTLEEVVWGFWHVYKMAGTFNLTVEMNIDGSLTGKSARSITKTLTLEVIAFDTVPSLYIVNDLNDSITQYSSATFAFLITQLLYPFDICINFGDGHVLKNVNVDSSYQLPSWTSVHVVRPDVYRLVVSHTYASPGLNTIELTALHQSTWISVNVSSILNTFGSVVILPLNATKGEWSETTVLAIFMENIITGLKITIDFGDGFIRQNSTVTETLIDYTDLLSHQSRYRYIGLSQHRYTADGSFKVSVTVGNNMAWPFGCLTFSYSEILIRMCKKPSVSIVFGRSDVSKNNTYERRAEIHLLAMLQTNCIKKHEAFHKYLWSVTKAQDMSEECVIRLGNQNPDILLKKACCNNGLRLPAFSLDFGLYCITIEVMEQTISSNESLLTVVFNATMVRIIPSPIIARINSTFHTDSIYEITSIISLTANSSYDTNEVNGATSELTFYWMCVHINAPIEEPVNIVKLQGMVEGEDVCVENRSAFQKITNATITLKTTDLLFSSLPTDYYFFVSVSRKHYSNISPPFKVRLVQGSPPKLSVECEANCDYTQNPEAKIRLRYTCYNCLEREMLLSTWNVVYILDNRQSVRIDISHNVTTNTDDKTMEFPSEIIHAQNRNQIATVVTITVTRKDKTSGEAVLLLAKSSLASDSKYEAVYDLLTSSGLHTNVCFILFNILTLLFSLKTISYFRDN